MHPGPDDDDAPADTSHPDPSFRINRYRPAGSGGGQPGVIALLSFQEVQKLAPDCPGTYFSLDYKCITPAPPAECSCPNGRLRPCSHPCSLGVHAKPIQPMNRGESAFLSNTLTVGFDIATASIACPYVFVNCFAGEHRTGGGVVARLWFLGYNTLDAILSKILRDNPGRAALLSKSLRQPRRALKRRSVLEAVVLHLN